MTRSSWGHALVRAADRRALAGTTCSLASGSAGDQEQLQGACPGTCS
ncbi:TPA: hypothetical protein QHA87_003825 [Aeromonas dhakensis]|nr:hypothetical protein [Aeromonas dhakensis]